VILELPDTSAPGVLEGSLTVAATAGAGVSQQVAVPLVVILTPAAVAPSESPSPGSSPATTDDGTEARSGDWRWRPVVLRLGLLF
jgi:hypothetical protein